jgi:hypothetical protein
MDLPSSHATIADKAEPLFVGMELHSCGGCGATYTVAEGECPECGPRAAKPRWFDAPAPGQMPEGIPALMPFVGAEVIA